MNNIYSADKIFLKGRLYEVPELARQDGRQNITKQNPWGSMH